MGLQLVPPQPNVKHKLKLEDLPLGPWAVAELQVWATKTGTRWHANKGCATLRTKARTEIHQQPADGRLGDRNVPENLHCEPSGPLGDYLRTARHVVRFATTTDDAEARLGADDIPLGALPFADRWSLGRDDDPMLESGPLAEIWAAEQDRRSRLTERSVALLSPNGERMGQIAIAGWIRSGRTSRHYQKHFMRYVAVAEDGLDRENLAVSGSTRRFVTDRLSDWLDDIVSGRSPENASRGLVDKECAREASWPKTTDELLGNIRRAWTKIVERWRVMLESMAQAYPGALFAVFHYYGGSIDRDVLNACIDAAPGALLNVGDRTWAAAVVPAALRLQLAERDRGLNGLVLLDEDVHLVDSVSTISQD